MEEKKNANSAHVVVVPFPGQGQMNPMLQFSLRLVSKGLKVTFVVTKFIYFSNHLQLQLFSSSFPDLQFDTISDGYDEGGSDQADSKEAYLSRFHSVGSQTLAELITKYQASSNPIDCVVYEPFVAWALDLAKQFGLVAAAFFTRSCAAVYIFYSFFHRKFSVAGTSSPVAIKGLPELEIQDLPSFIPFPEAHPANFKMTMSRFSNLDKADYILINTFYNLESEVVDIMSKERPNLLTIGPAVPSFYLDKRIETKTDYGIDLFKANSSVDSIISWLSTKPAGSVVYVAFGSLPNINKKQLEEIAWGLKNTNFYFLWVVRKFEEANLPNEFLEEVGEKGLVVNWCPQVKVLSNEAIGCFFSHCGWNSTVEALSLGVPMVTLPQWSDQPTNSKFVEDVWKVGIRASAVDDSGIAKREEIEFCIEEVMDGVRGKEMKNNCKKWKELAIGAVSEGGTSDKNINQLVSKFIASKR